MSFKNSLNNENSEVIPCHLTITDKLDHEKGLYDYLYERLSQPGKKLPHTRLYLETVYKFYLDHNEICDDEISRKVFEILANKDDTVTFLQLLTRLETGKTLNDIDQEGTHVDLKIINKKYSKYFCTFNKIIHERTEPDFSGREKKFLQNLIKSLSNKISESTKGNIHINEGSHLKIIYILYRLYKDQSDSVQEAVKHLYKLQFGIEVRDFFVSELIKEFVSILGKDKFLTYTNMCEDKNLNFTSKNVRIALEGLAKNFAQTKTEKLSTEDGYKEFLQKFGEDLNICGVKFPENLYDLNDNFYDKLAENLNKFYSNLATIETEHEWNKLSVFNYIAEYVVAMKKLPIAFGFTDGIDKRDCIQQKIINKLSKSQWKDVSSGDYELKIWLDNQSYKVCLKLGPYKTVHSAVEKILRDNGKLAKDVFRFRIEIPELTSHYSREKILKYLINNLIYTFGVTEPILLNFKNTLNSTRSSDNAFSRNFHCCKFVLDLTRQGLDKIEVMIASKFPDSNHDSYKCDQFIFTRPKSFQEEVVASIDYLYEIVVKQGLDFVDGYNTEVDYFRLHTVYKCINSTGEKFLSETSLEKLGLIKNFHPESNWVTI